MSLHIYQRPPECLYAPGGLFEWRELRVTYGKIEIAGVGAFERLFGLYLVNDCFILSENRNNNSRFDIFDMVDVFFICLERVGLVLGYVLGRL